MPCDQVRNLELVQQRKANEQREKSRKAIRDQAKKLGWQLTGKGDKFTATKPNGDKINFEILKDGTIKTTTDKISMANHTNAEAFLRNIATELGGKWIIRHKHGKGVEHSHEILAH